MLLFQIPIQWCRRIQIVIHFILWIHPQITQFNIFVCSFELLDIPIENFTSIISGFIFLTQMFTRSRCWSSVQQGPIDEEMRVILYWCRGNCNTSYITAIQRCRRIQFLIVVLLLFCCCYFVVVILLLLFCCCYFVVVILLLFLLGENPKQYLSWRIVLQCPEFLLAPKEIIPCVLWMIQSYVASDTKNLYIYSCATWSRHS